MRRWEEERSGPAAGRRRACSWRRAHLDGVESQLYDGALLRRERLGLLADHVLLKATANKGTEQEVM